VIYLDLDDLLHIAERTLGHAPELRDIGLLESAAARPRTTVFGQDAYPDLATKTVALLQSVTRNRPLIDGNERPGLAASIAFVGLNGRRFTWSNNEAYDIVIAVATGEVGEVAGIAAAIADALEPWDD
jgi:death-on-curing protein